jgi:hypothetical protein
LFAKPDISRHPQQPIQDFVAHWNGTALIGCSTSGHFLGNSMSSAEIIVTIVTFNTTRMRLATVDVAEAGGSRAAGRELGIKLARVKLSGVLVIGTGTDCNGNAIAAGLSEVLPGTPIIGGFAAHDPVDGHEWVMADGEAKGGYVTGVGFLGDDIIFGHGSAHGWESFGPERRVTRSDGNVLHQLDNQSVLGLYREYLGDLSARLPGTAALFPLSIPDTDGNSVVRTACGIDGITSGMRFGHDLIEDTHVRLMRSSRERLIESAQLASLKASTGSEVLAIAIGGTGRQLVLGQYIDDELAAITSALATTAHLTGMYAQAELAMVEDACQLQNQSMTVLTLAEREPA